MRIAREVALYNQGGIKNGIDSAEDRASKVATSFITRVSESEGIKVHNADDLTDYIQINSNGVDLVNDNVSIANFGESARVGKVTSSRFMVNADSLEAYDDSNNKYFEISASGMTYGPNTVASTGYADGKASAAQAAAISTAASDATTKANAAAQTATNFITTDSTGIKVHNTNDSSNYTHIGSAGMDVYKGGDRVARFGSTIVLGDESAEHLYVGSDGLLFSDDDTSVLGVAVDDSATFIFTPSDITLWPGQSVLNEGSIDVLGKVTSNGVLLSILKVTDYTGPSLFPLPITITDSRITANMEVVHSVLSNPSAQTGDWTVTTSDGSLTVSGSQSGGTNITLYLAEPVT